MALRSWVAFDGSSVIPLGAEFAEFSFHDVAVPETNPFVPRAYLYTVSVAASLTTQRYGILSVTPKTTSLGLVFPVANGNDVAVFVPVVPSAAALA